MSNLASRARNDARQHLHRPATDFSDGALDAIRTGGHVANEVELAIEVGRGVEDWGSHVGDVHRRLHRRDDSNGGLDWPVPAVDMSFDDEEISMDISDMSTHHVAHGVNNQDKRVCDMDRRVVDMDMQVADLDKPVQDLDTRVTNLDTRVTNLDTLIAELDMLVAHMHMQVANMDALVADLEM